MSLSAAFQIGRSSLTASQIATQVIGNNIANAATPGYSRQLVDLSALSDQQWGRYFVGRGVEVTDIRRSIDEALQQRLNGSISGEASAATDRQLLSGIEQLTNTISDSSLKKQLTAFYNSWSQLANAPAESGARSLVVQQGKSLASSLRKLKDDLGQTRSQIDQDLATSTNQANNLLDKIAQLNSQIVTAEQGQGGANGLRDQRDQLVAQLAQFVDITTVQQPSGSLDVLVGSSPVVLAGQSRGIQLKRQAVGDQVEVSVSTIISPEQLTISSGRIGSLLTNRGGIVDSTITQLDTFTSQLIFQVNKLHSQGFGTTPLTSVTGEQAVRTGDQTLAFNDPLNQTFSALPYRATSGSFTVTIKNAQTGSSQSIQVPVDLDGLTSALAPGFADDTSLSSLTAYLNANVPNLNASITGDGKLKLDAASGYQVSFSDDTSGILATLGVNTYFTGTNASDIKVRSVLESQPGLLAAGRISNGQQVDNGITLAISSLSTQAITDLGSQTLGAFWDAAAGAIATQSGAAKTNSIAASTVREGLDAQRSAVSGVSIDEEAINLANYQRQYEASARFISVVNDLSKTLLQLV